MQNKLYILFTVCLFSLQSISAQSLKKELNISGKYAKEKPQNNFGLEAIYILENLSSSQISYTSNSSNINFYYYTDRLQNKQQIPNGDIISSGNTYILSNLKDEEALVIEEDGQTTCFWIIDYSKHRISFQNIYPIIAEDNCEVLKLKIDYTTNKLIYRGISGQLDELKRSCQLTYETLIWNEDSENYQTSEKTETIRQLTPEYILSEPPVTNTHFTITGDQYATQFGQTNKLTSTEEYIAIKPLINITLVQTNSKGETSTSKNDLGGSAPIDIDFQTHSNDAASFFSWYIYNTKDLTKPIARYTDKDLSYKFDQAGNFKVELMVTNDENKCIVTEQFTVSITDSMLEIPNFMNPKDNSGRYNTFRIAYKSLVKYNCVIVNRWGNKVFQSNNPEEAWDGKYHGSLVKPGVYFYSIEATGADGKKYKKGGDINVLY